MFGRNKSKNPYKEMPADELLAYAMTQWTEMARLAEELKPAVMDWGVANDKGTAMGQYVTWLDIVIDRAAKTKAMLEAASKLRKNKNIPMSDKLTRKTVMPCLVEHDGIREQFQKLATRVKQ
jgi:hypothetical protein